MTASYQAPKYTIYIGGREQAFLELIQASRGLNMAGLETCRLRVAANYLTGSRECIVRDGYTIRAGKTGKAEFQADICEVWVDPPDDTPKHRIHYGTCLVHQPSLSPKNEDVTYESRLAPFMFGKPFDGILCSVRTPGEFARKGPGPRKFELLHSEAVFNPQIDQQVVGNMQPGGKGPGGSNLFYAPTQLTTEAGVLPGVDFWTLADAINYLCVLLNDSEEWILNPTAANLAADDKTKITLRDQKVPSTGTLPEMLDSLILPHGFHWHLNHRDATAKDDKPRIKIWSPSVIASGGKTLKLPDINAEATFDNTEITGFHLRADYGSNHMNSLVCLGDVEEVEALWYLCPAWTPDLEGLDINEYDLHELQDAGRWASHRRVYRDWVLNEANLYDPDDYGNEARLCYNQLGNVFETPLIDRRRQFLPMIKLAEDGITPYGQWRGCHIEYFDPYETTSGPFGGTTSGTWKALDEIDNSHIQLLRRECGIRFTGEHISDTIYDLIQNPPADTDRRLIRIYATVRGDKPMEWYEGAVAADVLAVEQRQVHNLSHAFKWRRRHGTGDNATLDTTTAGKDRDDRNALKAETKRLLNAFLAADTSGQAPAPIPWANDIVGTNIRKLEGRDVDLTLRNDGPTKFKYAYPFVGKQTWYPDRCILTFGQPRKNTGATP